MTYRMMRGVAHATLAVPYRVPVEVDEREYADPSFPEVWRMLYNEGINIDELENADIEPANIFTHEVADFTLDSAEWEDKKLARLTTPPRLCAFCTMWAPTR